MWSSAEETSIKVVNKWAMVSINHYSPEVVSHYILYFLKIKNIINVFLLFSEHVNIEQLTYGFPKFSHLLVSVDHY